MLHRSTGTIFIEDNVFSLGDRDDPRSPLHIAGAFPTPTPRDCSPRRRVSSRSRCRRLRTATFEYGTQYVTATPVKTADRTTRSNIT